jgi:hypothetical protein
MADCSNWQRVRRSGFFWNWEARVLIKSMRKLKWIILSGLIAATVLGFKLQRSKPERINSEKYNQIFDEIASLDVSIGSLTPDFTGSTVAYIN